MKVIKEPVPISWNIEKECVANINRDEIGCGAVLEVDYTDIYEKTQQRFRSTGDWGEGCTETITIYAFKCPCCEAENEIKFNEIPDKIRKIIEKREKEKRIELKKK